MRPILLLLLTCALSACSIAIASSGKNNDLLDISYRSNLRKRLGEPEYTSRSPHAEGRLYLDLGEASSFDVFRVRGDWASSDALCTYGFLAMGTFGLSEVVAVPVATVSRITGSLSTHRLVAFYNADGSVHRFELYDRRGRRVRTGRHC